MARFYVTSAAIIIILSSHLNAQQGWTYYKYKDLPVTGIMFCIQTDYKGGIYLGLTGGLAKYNGFEWIRIYYNELDPMMHDNHFNIRRISFSNGYLWAGTNNGIIRFQGYEKKHYNPENTPSMPSDKIRGIAPDKYGNIWFLHHSLAISTFLPEADSVVNYQVPTTTPLPFAADADIFCDSEDNLWYSADGGFVKFSGGIAKVLSIEDIPGLDEKVNSIQIMTDNTIAVLTEHKLFKYKDYKGEATSTEIDIPEGLLGEGEFFKIIKTDLEGNLWILSRIEKGSNTTSKHFYKYSKKGEWSKYSFPKFDGIDTDVYSLTDFTVDEKGRVWFSDPYYGVFVFNPKEIGRAHV